MLDNFEDLGMRKFVCFEGLDRFTIDRVQWITEDGQLVIGRPVEFTRRERAWKTSFANPDRRRRNDDEAEAFDADASGQLPPGETTDGNVIYFEPTGRNGTLTQQDRMRLAELGARPHCPAGHLLPPDFDKRPTLVYGLVGQSGSGKSQEVGVLPHVVRRGKGLGAYHLVAELSPFSHQHYTDEYWWYLHSGTPHKVPGIAIDDAGEAEEVVDTRPRPVPITTPASATNGEPRKPIILVLRNTKTNKSVNVLLYDPSGEDQGSAESQARYNKFLMLADGLLVFVPPWALDELRPHIAPSGDVIGQSMQGTENLLDALASNLRKARNLSDDAELRDVPTMLLLSKADQVSHVPSFRSEWLEPTDRAQLGIGGLLQRIEDETGQLADFFTEYGEEAFMEKLPLRYGDIRIQALSATGCPVDETGHYVQRLTPRRVAEPLLYMLSHAGEGKRVLDGRAD
jgi:hypothetical protein